MKRKRSTDAAGDRSPKRRSSPFSQSAPATPSPPLSEVQHPVLRRLYPDVCDLRHYVLSRLPGRSKNRRRRIAQLGQVDAVSESNAGDGERERDCEVARLLDSTLVGVCPQAASTASREAAGARSKEMLSFSQQLSDGCCVSGSTYNPGYFLQAEVVDFVIWLLFKRNLSRRPSHLLCQGYQRSGPVRSGGPPQCLPGIVSNTPNSYVKTLKGTAWCHLHALLGEGGDGIIMDLILDCGIFYPVEGTLNNYYQISGIPLSEIKPDAPTAPRPVQDLTSRQAHLQGENRTPSEISFVRSRLLYARAALNEKGGVRFGMRHIHVLNRFPHLDNEQETVHIMRYIFPRQFGLHNVFTSKVDTRETAMPFKDYTLREKEISAALQREMMKKPNLLDAENIVKLKSHLPRRLRGEAMALVKKMRKLNQRCSYVELLRHYCPVEGVNLSSKPPWHKNPLQLSTAPVPIPIPISSPEGPALPCEAHEAPANQTAIPPDQPTHTIEETSFTRMACPTAHVSAFARAAIANVIPHAFWGPESNRHTFLYWADQFVSLRRFETLTLHQVVQKIQISSIPWLRPPTFSPTADKMSKSDSSKRLELFLELIYWLFDSFLIPIIRSNFHVTESNVHKNRLFYFRHDVWRMLSEPSLAQLRMTMYEELPTEKAAKMLSSRALGFSKIRLLPKKTGVRVITNLKRRQPITRNGVTFLGRSINSVMAPVFNVLNFEKSLQPSRFGSSLFSVADMFPKLCAFKTHLQTHGLTSRPLYFAKVDVQSCFDTIPQSRLLAMIESLLAYEAYETGKHVEISPLGPLQRLYSQQGNAEKEKEPLPVKQYVPHTRAAGHLTHLAHGHDHNRNLQTEKEKETDKFLNAGNGKGKKRKDTVFVDTGIQATELKGDLMALLREHVERNVVKIGKRFYRQRAGIPQGSILSSLLCNFFYAEFEREMLHFIGDEDGGDGIGEGSNGCLLMRLLDDFLLITTEKDKAERFVGVMHRQHDKYGVRVKREKSLVNFDVETEDGFRIGKMRDEGGGGGFPYCGVLIDTGTLEVSKDRGRGGGAGVGRANVVNSLTIDMAKVPGQSFHRKTLNAFKIQLQAMFIDPSLNSIDTILSNLYQSFHDAAVRCFAYARCLNNSSKPRPTQSTLLIKTVDALAALAGVLVARRTRNRGLRNIENVRNSITKSQIRWLACSAFEQVFRRRQTLHGGLLAWVRREMAVRRTDAVAWRAAAAAAAVGGGSVGGGGSAPRT